jgi:pimeloyl-ACP methyl ester carboxylesterase
VNKKRLFRYLKILILLYCTIGILAYYLQDYFMFQPVPLTKNHKYDFSYPHREINIPFNENANINIVQFLTADSTRKGIVLYFHGNRRNISWYAKYSPLFTKNGYEVWMIDYPGFGKTTGEFAERVIYEYSSQLYKLARRNISADSIIIYGKSMGTGIAAQLAANQTCSRLILETPYYSFTSLAAHYLPVYPVSQIIRMRIPSYEYVSEVKARITIFHGTDDGTIPYSNAIRLKPLLKSGDEFVTIEGGSHNDLQKFPVFVNKLDSILKQN